MPDGSQRIEAESLRALEQESLAAWGTAGHGLVLLRGASSWEAHERGHLTLPATEGALCLPVAYDERGGPYATDATGAEDQALLLSLTDEDGFIACAWARRQAGSPLLGVGVDLSPREDFCDWDQRVTRKGHRLEELLFTPRERELAPLLCPDDRPLSLATLFAAKEAAFKATAAPLRRWYDAHTAQLRYEVRHFVMEEPGLERGTGRNGAAQRAMDQMGIARIEVHHTEVCGMALVVAVALGA